MSRGIQNRVGRPPELQKLYVLIRTQLDEVEQILRDELHSRYPFVDRLVKHGFRLGGKRLRPALLLLSGQACGELTPEHRLLAAELVGRLDLASGSQRLDVRAGQVPLGSGVRSYVPAKRAHLVDEDATAQMRSASTRSAVNLSSRVNQNLLIPPTSSVASFRCSWRRSPPLVTVRTRILRVP